MQANQALKGESDTVYGNTANSAPLRPSLLHHHTHCHLPPPHYILSPSCSCSRCTCFNRHLSAYQHQWEGSDLPATAAGSCGIAMFYTALLWQYMLAKEAVHVRKTRIVLVKSLVCKCKWLSRKGDDSPVFGSWVVKEGSILFVSLASLWSKTRSVVPSWWYLVRVMTLSCCLEVLQTSPTHTHIQREAGFITYNFIQ